MLPAWLNTLHHDGSEKYVSNLYPRLRETIQVRLRVGENAPVKRLFLRIFPDGEQFIVPMKKAQRESPVQWWEVDLHINEPTVHYRFLVEAEDGIWWYTAAGPTNHEPLDNTDFRILADYNSPAWLQETVFYQIFPDTFANGDPSNDPQPHEYEFRGKHPTTYPWGTAAPDSQSFHLVFYGGDLPGIVQRLDYLEMLGVTALYLNPIFTAYTNHKYDVVDYESVDPHLGGNDALIQLRQALNERNMRYIVDIVPNHCGYYSHWFQNARQNPNAQEAEFFTFNNHPNDYATWLGVWSLPKLNYRSAELRRRIYEGVDAIFRRWLKPPYSADGWRVDVANMLGRQGETQVGVEVGRGIRQAVKETRADAYLMGENFFDASVQLQGDQLDGVMNYMGMSIPLQHWLRGYQTHAPGLEEEIQSPHAWPTTALETTWRARRAAIPWAIALQQYNLLDSHDTSRIRSVLGGNDALHRLAVVILMTFPGVPSIYYGDEIGMEDVPRFRSRGCMIWDETEWDTELLDFHRRLIALRRRSKILQRGGFQMLAVEEDTFAYQRESSEGRIIVVAHRSKTPRPAKPMPVEHGGIPNGTRFVEFFSNQGSLVEHGVLPLPEHPQGATLWTEQP